MNKPEMDRVDFLVHRQYPGLVLANVPPSLSRLTPSYVPRHQKEEIQEAAEKYRKDLLALPEEEIQALYQEEARKLQAEAAAKEKALFFNRETAKADIDHWSRAAHWSLEEAVALSFGKEPTIVNTATLAPYAKVSPFPQAFARRLDLALRAVSWEKLFDPVLPGIFIGWLNDNAIDFPAELETHARDRGNFLLSWKKLYDGLDEKCTVLAANLASAQDEHAREREALILQRDQALAELAANAGSRHPLSGQADLGARERESLLKLVIGLAVGGYGYDPKSARNSKAAEMASDLARTGVPLDDDTIRKWLKAAAELVPPTETE